MIDSGKVCMMLKTRNKTFSSKCLAGIFTSVFFWCSMSSRLAADDDASFDLEKKISLSTQSELKNLEFEVVRQIQIKPRSAYAHYLVAMFYLKQFKEDPSLINRFKQASDLGQQALELDKNSEFGYLITANVLDIMGFSEKAKEVVTADLNENIQESWRTLAFEAKLISSPRDYGQFDELMKRALALEPKSIDILAPAIAGLLSSFYSPSDRITKLKAWNKNFHHDVFDLAIGIAQAESEKFQEADSTYKHLLAHSPSNNEASINQAIIRYRKLGNSLDAIKAFNASLEKLSPSELVFKEIIYAHLGRAHLENGENKLAEQAFISAMKEAKSPVIWIGFLADSYDKAKQYASFTKLLKELNEIVPGHSSLYGMRGRILSENLNNQTEAIEAYSNGLILDPHNSQFYTGIGLAHYRNKDISVALSFFEKATKVNPRDATARYNEACMLSMLGRTSEALGSLREALILDPELTGLARSDSDLDNLRESDQFEDIIAQTSSPSISRVP